MQRNFRTAKNKQRWDRKAGLRIIYHDLYRRMADARVPGRTLEVGGGSGIFKEFDRAIVSTDLEFFDRIDVLSDAQALPFCGAAFANIVLFDVLHHIEFPIRFLAEAGRILCPGGRLIMVEPAITLVSWPFYRFLHEEPVRLDVDPLADGQLDPDRDAFDANMAIPTQLFVRHYEHFRAAFPRLVLRKLEWLSLFAYPLSGGFQPWSLIPAHLVAPVLRFEKRVPQRLRRRLAFRILVVLEKTEN